MSFQGSANNLNSYHAETLRSSYGKTFLKLFFLRLNIISLEVGKLINQLLNLN